MPWSYALSAPSSYSSRLRNQQSRFVPDRRTHVRSWIAAGKQVGRPACLPPAAPGLRQPRRKNARSAHVRGPPVVQAASSACAVSAAWRKHRPAHRGRPTAAAPGGPPPGCALPQCASCGPSWRNCAAARRRCWSGSNQPRCTDGSLDWALIRGAAAGRRHRPLTPPAAGSQ